MTVFEQNPVNAAQELLGWTIICGDCVGKVVETEAYAEYGDEACHTFSRQSAREFVAKHEAGAVYVYLNYGVHWLLNFLTVAPSGERGFVLVRALEPVAGLDVMHQRRTKKRQLQDRDLCSGPGKLTAAMGIGPECHEINVGDARCLFFLEPGEASVVLSGPRIGISKAVEKPWRFGLAGNVNLSRNF